jgi:hypothetical protein
MATPLTQSVEEFLTPFYRKFDYIAFFCTPLKIFTYTLKFLTYVFPPLTGQTNVRGNAKFSVSLANSAMPSLGLIELVEGFPKI